MDLIELVSLFGIMAVMAAVPSTSVLMIVSRSAVFGFPSGASAAVGIVTGDLLFVVLAAAGATAAAAALGEYFVVAKYLAGLYLIWFGIFLLRRKRSAQIAEEKQCSLVRSYFFGLLFTLGDLKAVFFYVSLFPAFVEVEHLSPGGIAEIALATVVTVGSVKLVYAYLAHRAAIRATSSGRGKWVEKVAGGILVGAGALMVARA